MQRFVDALESRLLCSTTVYHVAVAAAKISTSGAAAKVPSVQLSANPSLTDASLTYQNFSTDPLFAPAGPTANDVNQGELGDCYFLATLSAVAKVDPTLIQQDITTNTDGTYTVKLYSGKTVKQVRVTDSLPTFADGTLAYAGLGQDGCTWVAIEEKAYATVRTKVSSYAALEGGWMSDAFNALGVRNNSVYAAASTTVLGKTLAADQRAGDAMTYATSDSVFADAPLYADHAYSVDSFTVNSKGQLLSLTLRNPWGNTEPAMSPSRPSR